MPRVKCPARSRRKNGQGPVDLKTGCARPRVAPATPNCPSEPERRLPSTAAQPARASARTVDGESARRLPELDSILTSNTVARARRTPHPHPTLSRKGAGEGQTRAGMTPRTAPAQKRRHYIVQDSIG
jgi:hypothetical protein